jgi:hypothetical protein
MVNLLFGCGRCPAGKCLSGYPVQYSTDFVGITLANGFFLIIIFFPFLLHYLLVLRQMPSEIIHRPLE